MSEPTLTFSIIIPARLSSTRLANKPLADLAGQPMIERVWRACQTVSAAQLWIATDAESIVSLMQAKGANCMLTSANHVSGTDRLAEVATNLALEDDHIIVNVQGDEPCIPAAVIEQVAHLLLRHPHASLATLYEPIESLAQWQNSNAVKLITDDAQRVLYFSRAAIPHDRDQPELAWQQGKRHLGIYAYRVSALKAFSQLPPGSLEAIEALEQLRFLQAGLTVVAEAACESLPAGVDTPDDLLRMQAYFAQQASN